MRLYTGCAFSLGLVLAAATANAQVSPPQGNGGPPYRATSNFSGPYGAAPPQAPPYAGPPPGEVEPAYGPPLLPPREVYAIVRETGFLPIGLPRQRGMFYLIGVTDRRGEDGRLVIDGRTGQIVRFVPAYRMGDVYGAAPMPYPGRLPPVTDLGDPRQPPASVPKMASRSAAVPIPRSAPSRPLDDKPLAEKPAAEPPQQSAAVQVKPAGAPPVVPAVDDAKPVTAQIRPTQPMPSVQGLE
jgi:hypothetical protein